MEIGIYTFADVGVGRNGIAAEQRIPELLDEIALADQVGLDFYGIGEHHREGFAAPAPAVLLAAGAARTKTIRLSSAVSVLGTDDPVRVFEQYAALDLVSSGRAELMVGRGALTDSFRIFGQNLQDYDDLFAEKLDLLLAIRKNEPVTWSGRFRPPLKNELILPRPVQSPLPVWLAVGGNPESIIRAGRLGLPIAVAMLGGKASRFAPMFDLHRRVLAQFGQAPQPAAITMHGFVARTCTEAADIYFPAETEVMNRLLADRGVPPITRRDFDAKLGRDGAYIVGSPEEVADKILYQHELFGHQRTLIQMPIGNIRHRDLMRAIELLGTRVAPIVRKELTKMEQSDAVA